MSHAELVRRAASAVRSADALLIGAGAGMGVDSGLPDFRGTTGFWKAYPLYAKRGLDFQAMANPRWFMQDPAFAWGFYGHRLALYRETVPHEGFSILRRWGEGMRHGTFVFTSNVDGQFQKAGFAEDRIVEIHGSIHYAQCFKGCEGIFTADAFSVALDMDTLRAKEPLPACPRCGALARPNILMFGDGFWDGARSDEQEARLEAWLRKITGAKIVAIECGAGTAIPSVRMFSERLARAGNGTLVRINVREPEGPANAIGLPMGALEALRAIDAAL
jgi:NAD-dependent SIR2 family protein deacetylase